MEIKFLLKSIADEYAASLGELDTRVSEKSFKKGSYFTKLQVYGSDPFKIVRDAAIDMGTVLSEDRESGIVVAMLGDGIASKAPVILTAAIEGSEAFLGAYSKEGLIKQKAAQKAIRAFTGLLQQSA